MKLQNQKQFIKTVMLVVIFTFAFLIGYTFGSNGSSGSFTISSGIYPGAATYTIYKEGNTYYAKNAYGAIEFSGTDAATVIQTTINALNKGTILIKAGEYPLSKSLILNKTVSLCGEGKGTELQITSDVNGIVLSKTPDGFAPGNIQNLAIRATSASYNSALIYINASNYSGIFRNIVENVFLWRSAFLSRTGCGIKIETTLPGTGFSYFCFKDIYIHGLSTGIILETIQPNSWISWNTFENINIMHANQAIYIHDTTGAGLGVHNNFFINVKIYGSEITKAFTLDGGKRNVFLECQAGDLSPEAYSLYITSAAYYNVIILGSMPASVFIGNNSNIIKFVRYLVTENSGTATITAGNTYVTVTHGLSITPDINRIKVTPKDNLNGRSFWVGNVTSTTFRIYISSSDTVNHSFGWSYD
ncbi:MAG: hypothetical protein QXE06_06995 [Candidatus Bathyarchaeia archaeon]